MRRCWPSNEKWRVWVKMQWDLGGNNNVCLQCDSSSKTETPTVFQSRHGKKYSLFQTEMLICRLSSILKEAKAIPCWAANPRIAHIWKYPLPWAVNDIVNVTKFYWYPLLEKRWHEILLYCGNECFLSFCCSSNLQLHQTLWQEIHQGRSSGFHQDLLRVADDTRSRWAVSGGILPCAGWIAEVRPLVSTWCCAVRDMCIHVLWPFWISPAGL